MKQGDIKLAVIGLGYGGLPLAVEFGRSRPVVGFDINRRYTTDTNDLKSCSCSIVTMPTPIDPHKRPDLGPLLAASVADIRAFGNEGCVLYDLKYVLEKHELDLRL